MRAICLAYHDVVRDRAFDSSGFEGEGPSTYKLVEDQFVRQLDALRLSGAPVPGIVTMPELPDPALLLTFDDGGSSAVEIARILEGYGWRGHFFITTDRIGDKRFVSAGDLRSLAKAGHVIGSHSCSHPDPMSGRAYPELVDEWRRSRYALESILEVPVLSASIPGGFYSKEVARAAENAGYQFLFTSEPRVRTWTIGGCLVFGRFMVKNGVDDSFPVRLLRSGSMERAKQRLWWEAKKVLKAAGGNLYFRIRSRLLKNRL